MFAWLSVGKSRDVPSTSEATMEDMGKFTNIKPQ